MTAAERRRPWALAQHSPDDGPGLVARALAEAGVPWACTRLDLGETLPALDGVGGVVVMGGAMGVHDDDRHHWLADERRWMAAAVDGGLPVLGVCLGAQQLALALGAAVTTGPAPEFGTGTVVLTEDGLADPVLGPEGPVLATVHWHRDTFALPKGARRLAWSDRCQNQAFAFGERVYGLQFHLEVDHDVAARWAPGLPPGATLDPGALTEVEAAGRRMLRRFVERVLA
ncbi:MAG TPA: type 1 glutamine amidotransferase [Acidimicrobiales bacterium]|nr:type 1 glutamine amidotransferase [Acidimicrobiales bacterium]